MPDSDNKVKYFLLLLLSSCLACMASAKINSGYGILFLDAEVPNFESRALEIAKRDFPELEFSTPAAAERISVDYEWVDINRFPLPKPGTFSLLSVGLKPEDRDRIISGKRTFFINFAYPETRAIASIHLISRYLDALMHDLPVAIWDDENRQILSPAKWARLRIDTWSGDQIDIRCHITMHAYRDPDLQRIITLGLKKFNLPDLVMDGVPTEMSDRASNTINYTAQFLTENGQAGGDVLDLDLHRIRHPTAKKDALAYPLKGAVGMAKLRLVPSAPEKGDPDNKLLNVDFVGAGEATRPERLAAGLAALYGADRTVLFATRTDTELLAARDRARKIFLQVKKPIYQAGLKPNERMLVKYGFSNGTDTEYMWVEIVAWNGDELAGIVINNADYIEGIKAGQRVKIPAPDIYDYLHYHPDGTDEGNETGKILERREEHK